MLIASTRIVRFGSGEDGLIVKRLPEVVESSCGGIELPHHHQSTIASTNNWVNSDFGIKETLLSIRDLTFQLSTNRKPRFEFLWSGRVTTSAAVHHCVKQQAVSGQVVPVDHWFLVATD